MANNIRWWVTKEVSYQVDRSIGHRDATILIVFWGARSGDDVSWPMKDQNSIGVWHIVGIRRTLRDEENTLIWGCLTTVGYAAITIRGASNIARKLYIGQSRILDLIDIPTNRYIFDWWDGCLPICNTIPEIPNTPIAYDALWSTNFPQFIMVMSWFCAPLWVVCWVVNQRST